MTHRPAVTRRDFLRIGGAGVALGVLPSFLRLTPGEGMALAAASAGRFFEPDEYATIDAAAARMIPDDTNPDGTPSPGAGPARVVDYVDRLLGAFEDLGQGDVPFIYAGAPQSDRNPAARNCGSPIPEYGAGANFMKVPVPLSRRQELAWRARIQGTAGLGSAAQFIRDNNGGEIVGYQETYRQGIVDLNDFSNQLFGADFKDLGDPTQQDVTLNLCPNQDFVGLLFEHTVEGMYANPEYGGNQPPDPSRRPSGADGTNRPLGWSYIGFEGDRQPLGYTVFVPAPTPADPSNGFYCEFPGHPMSLPNPGGPAANSIVEDLGLRAALPALTARLKIRR